MHRLIALAAVCVLAAFAAACASPASHFYTLNAATTPAATSSDLSVIVGPVSVPAVVDRPEIVVSTGPNQVRLDEFNRWASPLQNNISRVVVENLVAMLGTPRVTLFPQTLSANVDYRAAIEVQSFDSTPGEAAALDAVCTVRRTKDGRTETGRTTRARGGQGERLRCARRRPQPRGRTPEPRHRRCRPRARSFRAVDARRAMCGRLDQALRLLPSLGLVICGPHSRDTDSARTRVCF